MGGSMKRLLVVVVVFSVIYSTVGHAQAEDLAKQLAELKAQTTALQKQLKTLQAQLPKGNPEVKKVDVVPPEPKKTPISAQVTDTPVPKVNPEAKKIDVVTTEPKKPPVSAHAKHPPAHQISSLDFRSPDSPVTPSDDNKNKRKLFAKKRPIIPGGTPPRKPVHQPDPSAHETSVVVRSIDLDPESSDFYPTALVADGRVLTYIAGTPVVTSPYLGSRPAFDGSDYIVNISSINRDIRLMQQRRNLYRAYERVGYSAPNMPILMFSGKAEPMGYFGHSSTNQNSGDWTFSASELDLAAFLNDKVEAYMAIAYNQAPPPGGGQRVANSGFGLNLGFINIGDLDHSPIYFTAGQLFAPFGRYSTGMVSAPLTMIFSRVRTRPVILGYKSQSDSGLFAATYAFHSDTSLGSHAAGGFNLGYIVNAHDFTGEVGASVISSVNDATGMQYTGSAIGTTFPGFGVPLYGSEDVQKTPTGGVHATVSFDRYNVTAEWITNLRSFREQDLSFNGDGVQGSAGQLEAGVTFMTLARPSGFYLGYQWTNQLLALNLPRQRFISTYNISIWKDTVESIEYRHDINYAPDDFATGASTPGFVNQYTYGSNGSYDMLSLQIGVFF